MTLQPGPAAQLTVYLRLNARHGHLPMHTGIVRRAQAAGIAGACRVSGIGGFGRSGVLHTDLDPDMLAGPPGVVGMVLGRVGRVLGARA